ncbi:TetR/AcrR family transcriptional regulator [Enterococcus hirae]
MKQITENLETSLATLLTRKSFDVITISELADNAKIARRTFYLYYKDKHEFILSVIDGHLQKMKEASLKDRLNLSKSTQIPKNLKTILYSSEAFFYVATYVDKHRLILSSLMSKNSTHVFYDQLYRIMIKELHERIKLFNGKYIDSIPTNYIDQYYIGTIIGIFKVWLYMEQPEPVEIFLERLEKFQTNASYEFWCFDS